MNRWKKLDDRNYQYECNGHVVGKIEFMRDWALNGLWNVQIFGIYLGDAKTLNGAKSIFGRFMARVNGITMGEKK
jgi:hypothetical protein